MSLPSLYTLSAEYQQAMAILAELDCDEQTVADTLEGLAGTLEAKATNVAAFARNVEALSASIKEAEGQMAARRKALDARAARLREYIKTHMEACEITKIESPQFALTIKNNPPSVEIFNAELIPADYLREPPPPPAPSPDKALIAKAIKDGYEVPGCKLVKGTRLEIK